MKLPTLPSEYYVNIDFKRLLPVRPLHRLLDVGCGGGRHAAEACRYAGQVVALDIDRENLLRTRERAAIRMGLDMLLSQPDLILADAQHLPFKHAVFDRVICTEVVEHLPDDRAAVEEIVRVLHAGGLAAISTPAFLPEALFWRLSRVYPERAQGHVRVYGPGKLTRLLRSAGVRIYAVRGRHAHQVLYWFLNCLSGLPRREPTLVRRFRRFMQYQEYRTDEDRTAWKLEAVADLVIPKDRIVYAKKPRQAGQQAAGHAAPPSVGGPALRRPQHGARAEGA